MSRPPNSGSSASAFVVGDLYVDVGQQRVIRAGSDIVLPNLSFRLLVALINAAPNVISNESLMAEVWPRLVVSPETVNKRVNLLREALGDDARAPRYIAGLRSRGYRLVASVIPARELALPAQEPAPPAPAELESGATIVPPAASPPAPDPPRRLGRRLVAAVLVLGLVAVGVLGIRSAGLYHSAGTEPPATPVATVGERARTVAVLPFASLSTDSADAYLAQGVPEMILNRLSHVRGLSVIARDSSFALATRGIDSREIGRRLNSGYLIGGSVQRQSSHLRVAVRLVDTGADTLIWSAAFDRDLNELFSLEDDIAEQIAGALSTRLGEFNAKASSGARSANLDGYLAYLRGRTLLGRFTVADSEAAVPYFEKSIALDPSFASAYVSLYETRMQAADRHREDLNLARRQYRHLIDRALELNPTLGAAYFARAMWAETPVGEAATPTNPLIAARAKDFQQGAALDPSNGRGLTAYADFLSSVLEQPGEGRRMLTRALWVDPLSPYARFKDAELSLDESGIRESERKTLEVLELDPDFVPALSRYAGLRWMIDGQLAESIQLLEHAIALDPKNFSLVHTAMTLYLDLGDVPAAHAVVAGMPTSARAAGLFALRAGDWRAAGRAAYDESGWTDDSDYCQLWQAKALRDYALRTGELGRAIAFMKDKFYLDGAAAAHVEECNVDAAIYLAQLLTAAGKVDEGRVLQRAATAWIDANEAKFHGGLSRLRAGTLLLERSPDAALAALAQAFRSGCYAYWWYTLEFDPTWQPLHGDPRFRAIVADVHRYVDAERSELEALRRSGRVPRRDNGVAAH